jgi:hypothetical protein
MVGDVSGYGFVMMFVSDLSSPPHPGSAMDPELVKAITYAQKVLRRR